MNPFEPNTVTTSPENEDLPPRPRFIPEVLSCLGLISEDMEATEVAEVVEATEDLEVKVELVDKAPFKMSIFN